MFERKHSRTVYGSLSPITRELNKKKTPPNGRTFSSLCDAFSLASEANGLPVHQVFRHAAAEGILKPVPDHFLVRSFWKSVPFFFQALHLRIHRHVPKLLPQTHDAFRQVVNGNGAVELPVHIPEHPIHRFPVPAGKAAA